MAFNPLPDRERRHLLQFYVAPRLGYRARLGIAGGLILVGLFIQLSWRADDAAPLLIISLPFLLAGNLFLLVRGYDLRPTRRLSRGNWERTTRDRFQEVRNLEKKMMSWDETFADLTCWTGVASLVLLAGVVIFLCFLLSNRSETAFWAPVFTLDAAVLILPHWISGTRRAWRPLTLRQQIDALEQALATIERCREPACQIQPMFELAGEGKDQIPVGARVLIRFPDGPKDFLGLQFQVAVNTVQGTHYPYLYAVLIARKPFALRRHLKRIRSLCGGLTVETKSRKKDVDVIVLRQHTTRTSGYHTKPAAIARIAASSWISVVRIFAAEAHVATGALKET